MDYEYAMAEARNGMQVLIREGSAARNLDAIVKGIVEHHTDTSGFCFCTDDKQRLTGSRQMSLSMSMSHRSLILQNVLTLLMEVLVLSL